MKNPSPTVPTALAVAPAVAPKGVDLDDEDYALIKERLNSLFTEEELVSSGWAEYLATYGPTQEFRLQLSSVDLLFFFRFYLGHHFVLPLAPLHFDLIEMQVDLLNTPGDAQGVIAEPRGFGKTTTAMGCILWAACHNMRHYIAIISDSSPGAREQLGNIKAEIEENERIRADFGDLVGKTWAVDLVTLANGVRIQAFGAGQKIRGRKWRQFRPDYMIFDDIEELDQVYSPAQREARKRWFHGSAVRARGPDTKILVIGNILHNESLLAELLNNPFYKVRRNRALVSYPDRMDLWDTWEAILNNQGDPNRLERAQQFYADNRKAMDAGGVSAWPERYSVYDLMAIRSEGHAAFSRELQNDPAEAGKELFKEFHYYRSEWRPGPEPSSPGDIWLVPLNGAGRSIDVPLRSCSLFAFTDPALGKTATADYSAIVILAKSPQGYLYVLEADIERRKVSEAQRRQIELFKQYNGAVGTNGASGVDGAIKRWGMEAVAFQELYAAESAERAAVEGIEPALVPIIPVQQPRNKEMRIESLEPNVNSGWIIFKNRGQELLIQQLKEYGTTTHDDGPDALEGARTVALQWHGDSPVQVLEAESVEFDRSKAIRRSSQRSHRSNSDPFAAYEDKIIPTLEDRILDIQNRIDDIYDQPGGSTGLGPVDRALVKRLEEDLRQCEITLQQELEAPEPWAPFTLLG